MSVCQQRDITALPLRPASHGVRVEEKGPLERGCFYTASGIMGSHVLLSDLQLGTVNEAVCGGPLDSRWRVGRFVLQMFDDPELQDAASQYWSEELLWTVMETGSELMSL
ncbi:hypothetical protein ILYODFUR_038581 [Ilyodon furcidens]|uniref:MHC class I antigen n=1 Tax=Ilyodon furcidens TaxID=33524 RepID=A0ABV0VC32_9TELE